MTEPPEHEPPWVDHAIANLLRGGVVLSITVILIGLVTTFLRHPQYLRSHTDLGALTDAHVLYPHSLRGIAQSIHGGHGQGVVMLGLILLIATPVARVAFAIVAFALQRDRLYTAITTLVLLLLVVSFASGAAG